MRDPARLATLRDIGTSRQLLGASRVELLVSLLEEAVGLEAHRFGALNALSNEVPGKDDTQVAA